MDKQQPDAAPHCVPIIPKHVGGPGECILSIPSTEASSVLSAATLRRFKTAFLKQRYTIPAFSSPQRCYHHDPRTKTLSPVSTITTPQANAVAISDATYALARDLVRWRSTFIVVDTNAFFK